MHGNSLGTTLYIMAINGHENDRMQLLMLDIGSGQYKVLITYNQFRSSFINQLDSDRIYSIMSVRDDNDYFWVETDLNTLGYISKPINHVIKCIIGRIN